MTTDNNDPDRHADLLKSLGEMTVEEVAERIETLEDALHGFKSIAADLKREMDTAASLLTQTLSALNANDADKAYAMAAQGFASIAIANHVAKRVA